jgi:hypothetical protein
LPIFTAAVFRIYGNPVSPCSPGIYWRSENKKAPVFVGAEDGRSYIVKNTGSRTRLFGNPAILSAFAKASADFGPVVLRHRITPVLPVSETKLRM